MKDKNFPIAMGKEWAEAMKPFIESEEMDKIYRTIRFDTMNGFTICPKSGQTYAAFQKCPLDGIKVAIFLQSPYPSITDKGVIVADGLAMGCSNTGILQPSLEKLYEAIEDDCYNELDLHHEKTPDLSYLAEQGVLLANNSYTVRAGDASSHDTLWREFNNFLIKNVLSHRDVIFILMGKVAQRYSYEIDPFSAILECEHPVASSYAGRKMRHEQVFSITNKMLISNGIKPIEWLKLIKDVETT